MPLRNKSQPLHAHIFSSSYVRKLQPLSFHLTCLKTTKLECLTKTWVEPEITFLWISSTRPASSARAHVGTWHLKLCMPGLAMLATAAASCRQIVSRPSVLRPIVFP